jgi:hypothetical protein
MELLLGPLFVSVLLEVGTAEGLPVLNNTDFPSNCGNDPYHPSTGIQECGTLCENRTDCVAVIFTLPASGSAGDSGACAFKCRSDNPVHKDGIRAIVVRPHKATCPPSPAPPPAPPPFAPPSAVTDPDWLVHYEAANLLYANSALNASLFPYAGNGFLATHPVGGRGSKGGDGGSTMTALQKMSTLYVSGVFNGVAVQSPCEGGYCAAPRRRTHLPGCAGGRAVARRRQPVRAGPRKGDARAARGLRRWAGGGGALVCPPGEPKPAGARDHGEQQRRYAAIAGNFGGIWRR